LKQATLFIALLGAILLAGCGGNGDTTTQSSFNNGSGDQPFKPTTHLSHRSLVTNFYAGQLQVMDTLQDRLTTFTFAVGTQPTYMQPSPDGTLTFVNNTGSNSISSFNNNLESVKATIALGGWTESFVTSQSNKFGFAAVYNYSNGTFRTPGAIVRFNPTDGSLNTQIQFPNVRYIAMDAAEKHLLAFTDVDDSAHWVDLTTIDPSTQVPAVSVLGTLPSGTFSRPVAAFFSADSTKAFVLNCGTECGGALPPSVVEIDVTTPTAASVVKQWPVSGARRGLIDLTANKLYVAGSTTTLADAGGSMVQDGFFTVIDIAAQTASAPIRIGNGIKRWIRNINGVFWVASTNCGVQSCITMVNPSAGTAAVLSTAKGDGTGISLSANSGEVYTIEGGELYFYDQKGNPIIPTDFNSDVKGQASDVLYIN
jgi:DNA-binding beta-propeller fold protein YncE